MKLANIPTENDARLATYNAVAAEVDAAADSCKDDLDRIQLAFRGLRKLGYLTRANRSCCGSCLAYEVGMDIGKRAETTDLDGLHDLHKAWVGWHHQSNDSLDNREVRSALHLTWGGYGVEIIGLLARAGLRVSWNGSPDQSIQILPRPSTRHNFVAATSFILPNQYCQICSRTEADHLAWYREQRYRGRRVY